ncbi:hypothetical protein NMG60_11023076 [Bertholletia excelsa]
MEKHKCKLCLKSFVNGRALGGHMRSHMLNLYVPPSQLGEQTEWASASSGEGEEENEAEKGLLCYGLRENPKRSARLVDPEFVDAGSVVLQDRESETESYPLRRRSKRFRKSDISEYHHYQRDVEDPSPKYLCLKKHKSGKPNPNESPVSSISETSPEEDIAYCLMMLSRDKWTRNGAEEEEEEEGEDEPDYSGDSDDSGELRRSKTRARGKYQCETCLKVFRSYQALGGHRASHKKSKAAHNDTVSTRDLSESEARNGLSDEKIHECPVCFRVFASGQALGGHKRSHMMTGSSPPSLAKAPVKLIDLNLPAPIDDEEISQIELSAVSQALELNN